MIYLAKKKLLFYAIFLISFIGYSQNLQQINSSLNKIEEASKKPIDISDFLSNTHRDINRLPYFLEQVALGANETPAFNLTDLVIRELTEKEVTDIKAFENYITGKFETSTLTGKSRRDQLAYAKIVPIRFNLQTNKYEFLVSYHYKWNNKVDEALLNKRNNTSNARISPSKSSVLSTGNWYKIGVTKNGVYKINKALLTSLGLKTENIDPRNIRLYGNGGKLLSEKNAVYRPDDLIENSISVVGENDGVFDDTDYILFYGQGTDNWTTGTDIPFVHSNHYFSDTSFYFITADLGTGKRVLQQNSSLNPSNITTSSQDFYGYHELNAVNVTKSGREFFGEKFDLTTSYTFPFPIPDAVINDSVYVKSRVLSRSSGSSSYLANFSNKSFSVSCGAVDVGNYLADVGTLGTGYAGGILNSSILSVTISKLTNQATGWLDYIYFNCRRNLVFNQSQFNFRDRRTVLGQNTFAKYELTKTGNSSPIVWDVTNALNVKNQNYETASNVFSFTTSSEVLKEFVVFNTSSAYAPTAYGKIPNQNLHAIQQADFIIVTHPLFLSEARRVAEIHQQYDGLSYAVATTDEVYNEFSSGTPDITAIRDFVRMLYFRPTDPTKAAQYLLLLGDGSYKNKEINAVGNSALVPTYQTPNSTSFVGSFVTDDFFAMMDEDEGDVNNYNNDSIKVGRGDLPDIGVGRFPVRNKQEAIAVTNKLDNYYKKNNNFNVYSSESSSTNTQNNFPQGDWRNWICFIGDDEDGGLHTSDADKLSEQIRINSSQYNIDKIYLDTYTQVSTPGGDRYPDALNDLNRRIANGALIVNYTGHGGELGLAHERIIDVPQILNWTNKNNLPLMVTATCEFSRFDDPDRTSAGEYCLLNENGGAIALMTTVRVAYSTPNFILSQSFYKYAVSPMPDGTMPHLGDIYRLTKRDIGFSPNYMNFVILGDPALKLAYPEQSVYTTAINSKSVTTSGLDTLKSLSLVNVSGYVGDKNGNKLTNFNGVIFPTVFDKPNTLTTLGNDPGSPIMTFSSQKNILYKGKSEVKNGDFTFSFLVPKDISNNYGIGKISYYAHNGVNDANGYFNKIVIGGFNPNPVVDVQGPTIQLFMNDEKFVAGGLTDEKPKVYAKVSDLSGINTIGTGIGHDIVVVLDENTKNSMVLNDYYVTDLNTYQSGKIKYPLNELSEGKHTLRLKVWDVQNNSSSASTEFVVSKSAELALKHVLNYPNPFTTKTKFFIEHNQCCKTLKVLIQVYTISGKVVKSINQTINSEGFRLDGIEWDGKDEFGDKLARGVYIYRVSVSDETNKNADKIEKLVILN